MEGLHIHRFLVFHNAELCLLEFIESFIVFIRQQEKTEAHEFDNAEEAMLCFNELFNELTKKN